MSPLSLDILEEMEKMRGEIDRILGEDRYSARTFPFSPKVISKACKAENWRHPSRSPAETRKME